MAVDVRPSSITFGESALAITWPIAEPVLSEKDRALGSLKDLAEVVERG